MDRLSTVKRDFAEVLDLGCFDAGFRLPGARILRADPGFAFARAAAGVQIDEDRLPFADHGFDLVVSAGVLDQVNDLPGALTLIRRCLRPDGLFLGAFVGAGALPALRRTLRVAEAERPAARLHPQIDVRSAGDLLSRAGFALPVADVETLDVSYRSLARLIDDLRGMAASNILAARSPLTRGALVAAAGAFAEAADERGRTHERFEIIFLTGWAPDASQPQPARRGSATSSLAAALRPHRVVRLEDHPAIGVARQNAAHRFEQGVHRHRLEQHLVRARLDAATAQIGGGVGGDDDDRHARLRIGARADAGHHFESVHARHAQVEQQHVETLFIEQAQTPPDRCRPRPSSRPPRRAYP